MPLIVSGCGEWEANGVYYQQQNNPPIYVQSNQNHQILEIEQVMAQGYGGVYKRKNWVIQKINTCNGKLCHLYISVQNNNSLKSPPFSNNVEWKVMAGSLPVPHVRNGNISNNIDNNTKDEDDTMMENKSNTNTNSNSNRNQGTKRNGNYHFKRNGNGGNNGHSPSRKRTFGMFEEINNNNDCNQYQYQQPPNKRQRVDNNKNNWHHGNQCNDNSFNGFKPNNFNFNGNNNNHNNNNNNSNNKENFFRFGFK